MFDRIIDNMRAFAEVKRGKLGYSFLLLSDVDGDGTVKHSNLTEIYDGAVLAKEIGCDYFEVKPSYDMDHFLLSQPKAELAEARKQIEAMRALETESFRILAPVNLQYVLEDEPLVQPKEYTRCAVSEMRTLLTPSGRLRLPLLPRLLGQEDRRSEHPEPGRDLGRPAPRRRIRRDRPEPGLPLPLHPPPVEPTDGRDAGRR